MGHEIQKIREIVDGIGVLHHFTELIGGHQDTMMKCSELEGLVNLNRCSEGWWCPRKINGHKGDMGRGVGVENKMRWDVAGRNELIF